MYIHKNYLNFACNINRMEALRAQETEGKYRQYGDSLGRHLSTLDALLADVQQTLRLFDALSEENR